jgi:hypothetical protein
MKFFRFPGKWFFVSWLLQKAQLSLSLSLSQLWCAFISAGGIMEEMQGLLEQANTVMQEELNLELESVSLTGTDIIFEDSQPTASPSEQVVHNTGSHQQVNICIFDVR